MRQKQAAARAVEQVAAEQHVDRPAEDALRHFAKVEDADPGAQIDPGRPDRDVVVGLNFGGETSVNPHEHALACSIRTVCEKLQVTFTPPSGPQAVSSAPRPPTRRRKNAAR